MVLKINLSSPHPHPLPPSSFHFQPYSTTEKDLHREFDQYGPIERVRLVKDKEGKSRGYAFVVYEKERDMRSEFG